MDASAQRTDFGLRAKTNHYMREAWQKGKSLKNASTQQIDHNLMAVLQRTIKMRVSVAHQTTTYLQATSAQRKDYSLTIVLQRTERPRVVSMPQAVGAPSPKTLTHVGHILYRDEETLKVHPIRERSWRVLRGRE